MLAVLTRARSFGERSGSPSGNCSLRRGRGFGPLVRRISRARDDVPQGGPRYYPPKKILPGCVCQIDSYHRRFHLLVDMRINASAVRAPHLPHCRCQTACTGENFYEDQIRKIDIVNSLGKLFGNFIRKVKTSLDPLIKLRASNLVCGLLWGLLAIFPTDPLLASHRGIAMLAECGPKHFIHWCAPLTHSWPAAARSHPLERLKL